MPQSEDGKAGYRCPTCDHERMAVVDSRPHAGTIKRRRLCPACGARVSTFEHRAQYDRGESRVHGALRKIRAMRSAAARMVEELDAALLVLDSDGATEAEPDE